METKQVDKTFYEETGNRLKNTSQLKLLSILKNIKTNVTFLNIFKSYTIDSEILTHIIYDLYDVDEDEFWDNISVKIYGIPDVWWLLPMMNNVVNPFEYLEAGKQILVLKERFLYQILKEISNIGNI